MSTLYDWPTPRQNSDILERAARAHSALLPCHPRRMIDDANAIKAPYDDEMHFYFLINIIYMIDAANSRITRSCAT